MGGPGGGVVFYSEWHTEEGDDNDWDAPWPTLAEELAATRAEGAKAISHTEEGFWNETEGP